MQLVTYIFQTCLVEHCPQGCQNGGTCTGPNQCTCTSGWRGFDCRTRMYTIYIIVIICVAI